MPRADRVWFAANLYHIAIPPSDRFPDHFITHEIAEKLINATVAQRAEAFLRAIGKWVES
jgi:hypothetical protein